MKYLLLICVASLYNPSLHSAPPVDAVQRDYPFKRLFTTVQQRRLLDAGSSQTVISDGSASADAYESHGGASAAGPAKPETVRLSGFLLRADGQYTVWFDGHSDLSPLPPDSQAKFGKPNPKSLQVPVRIKQQSHLLKPGQVWLLKENRIKEGYQVPSTSASAADGQALALPPEKREDTHAHSHAQP